MNETEFDWDNLRLFLAIARNGGLAGAIALTGKSAPTLGRRMLALERLLGQELFKRKARGYDLTEAGEILLTKALALEERFSAIADSSSRNTAPLVKISAGIWVTHILCQNIVRITQSDPVTLRFIAADDIVDIGRREALVGVRNQRPDNIGLAGRKIGRVQFAVYAKDASVTTWAQVQGATPSARWVKTNAQSGTTIEVTSPRNALDLAQAGVARVVLPIFIGAKYTELQQISPSIDALQHDQWLVSHHEDRFLPEVRKVIDQIYEVLKAECARSAQG